MGVHREHQAADIYPAWKRAITSAEDSIVVFSPYFDALIERLIKNTDLPVAVVTDLSPESGAQDYLAQLRTIARMLERGTDVRHLDRVHAKVLWVDDGRVVYGSQNFTTYARGSKEASTAPASDLTDSTFVTTLRQWLTESTPIDTDLIDALIKAAKEPAAALAAAHKTLTDTYQRTVDEHAEAKARAARSPMSRETFAALTAAVRHPQGQARLTRTEMDEAGQYSWGTYTTMLADPGNDLTKWIVTDPNAPDTTLDLAHLSMHPALFTDTKRMAFLRVGKTRITYARFSVQLTNRPMRLRSPHYDGAVSPINAEVTVTFPAAVVNDVNMKLKFALRDLFLGVPLGAVYADCIFTGEDFTGHTTGATTPRAEEYRPVIEELFATPQAVKGFFRKILSSFTYSELGIENKNADEIFTEHEYELAVTRFAGVPVLLVCENDWYVRILETLHKARAN